MNQFKWWMDLWLNESAGNINGFIFACECVIWWPKIILVRLIVSYYIESKQIALNENRGLRLRSISGCVCVVAASTASSKRVSNQRFHSDTLSSLSFFNRGSEIISKIFTNYFPNELGFVHKKKLPISMESRTEFVIVFKLFENLFHCSVSGRTSSSHLKSGKPSRHSSYLCIIFF